MAVHRRLEVREAPGATVVTLLDHRVSDDGTLQELGRELVRLVEVDGAERLVLDFSRVEFMSSAALGQLIILDKKLKARGGQLVLCHLRPELREIFVLTKLDRLFDVREDEAEALASCARSQAAAATS
jgi:anti-sigma B factor antagonist